MQNTEEVLRTKKIKVTPQRMAVYSVLRDTRSHPNVEMIYKKLKPNYPAMSLATVYKTVDVLKKVGLIQELNVGEGGLRYDAFVEPHSHAYCESCSRVDDVESIPIEKIQDNNLFKKVREETGFTVNATQIFFYGFCPECQEKIEENV